MADNAEQNKFKNQSNAKGSWKRSATKFHDKIYTKAEKPDAKYIAEPGRYRLFVSYACPWASRCLMLRKLKGLEDVLALTVTGWELANVKFDSTQTSEYKGWNFQDEMGGEFSLPEYAKGFSFLKDIYELAHPGYTEEYKKLASRPVFSVPVLFDEKTKTIVTNESAEIIIQLNHVFNEWAKNPDLDLNYADDPEIQNEMQRVNSVVYPGINDGVYRCGFAQTQEAYEHAYEAHWKAMDEIEELLGTRRFLTGDKFTLSDVRLFVTLIRYDAVYYAHFKTSRNQLKELPNFLRYMKEIYNMPGVKETVRIDHIVKHYYWSQKTVNATGIWPLGPLKEDYLKYLEE
eukprot:snap_masked-scaffold_40-processed-gene-1.43-mRNA-1 protein AED:0.00 eAED:0.00 QI:0/-1/0/1/-1/1/1/0/344